MANSQSSKPQVLHFFPVDHPIDAERLIWAIRGILRTLDQADFASADWEEADRLSELVTAGQILSNQLYGMASEPDRKRRHARPRSTALEVVRA